MQEWISIAYGISLLFSAVCVLVVAMQKPGREQQIMHSVVFFVLITMMGYCFRINGHTLEELVLGQKLIYVGGCHLFYFMLLFYLKYCRVKVAKHLRYAMIIPNCIMSVVSFTFDKHHLLYESYQLVMRDGFYVLEKEYGIFHHVYLGMIAIYMNTILLIGIWYVRKDSKKRNRHAISLLFVAICPTVAYSMEKALDLPYELVPFGFLAAMILILYLVYRQKIYDLYGTAREYVFGSVDSALIVMDYENHYKGSNDLAMAMFPELEGTVLDAELDTISERLSAVRQGNLTEIHYDGKIYEAATKEIHKNRRLIGSVIWLSDMTEHKKNMQLLENYQSELEQAVKRKTETLKRVQEKVILGFSDVIESRDHVTGGHVKRTSGYVNILVDRLSKKDIFLQFQDESYARHVCLSAPLHDIGKIAIPDAILNKAGKYTDEEYQIMKEHPKLGGEIIDKTLSPLEDKEYYQLAKNMAQYHHERWDGTGYPNGTKGEEIPLCARIMAVADVFDALVSKRPYKEKFPLEKAFRIIEEGSGTQFDPRIVDVFFEAKEQMVEFYRNSQE